jgi:hypothetical protein
MAPRNTSKKNEVPQPNLFDVQTDLSLPRRLEVDGRVHRNTVQGFAFLDHKRRVRITAYQKRGLSGHVAIDDDNQAIFLSPRYTNASVPADSILLIPDAVTDDQARG